MRSFEALVGAIDADTLAEAALGPLAWGRKPVTSTDSEAVVDAALGPAAWGSKAAERAAEKYAQESPLAESVVNTARTVRFATYAAAGLATLAVAGYFVRSIK